MKKGKLSGLIKNMGWMTISNFASKILVFLMVPFYTYYLSTEGYGFYDLAYSAVILVAPLTTGNSSEALMRYSIVEKENTSKYFTASASASCVVSFFIILICAIAKWVFGLPGEYASIGYLLIGNIFYTLFSQFARGVDQVKDMALGGLVNSILLVAFTYLFVVVFGLSVLGCVMGTATAMTLSAAYIAVRLKFWKYIERPGNGVFLRLIRYGLPLSVNTLGWWFNTSFCRYAVALLISVHGAGLLAAAYKIPAIPKAIQQIFIQAWQISAIEYFDPRDSDGFFCKIYSYATAISSLLCSFITATIPYLALFLFSQDFYDAWIYVPILMLCLLFDCLGSIIGSVFSAVGNTRPIALSAIVSALATMLFCFVLIPLGGLWAAVLSSLISSVLIWSLRLYSSRSFIDLTINWKHFAVSLSVLIVQAVVAVMVPLGVHWTVIQLAFVAISVVIAIRAIDIKTILTGLKKTR